MKAPSVVPPLAQSRLSPLDSAGSLKLANLLRLATQFTSLVAGAGSAAAALQEQQLAEPQRRQQLSPASLRPDRKPADGDGQSASRPQASERASKQAGAFFTAHQQAGSLIHFRVLAIGWRRGKRFHQAAD